MPNQNHTLPVRIGLNNKSRAYWSLIPKGNVLVFVHGFGGGATSTWRDLPKLLLNDQQFDGYDLIFYEYNSLRAPAEMSAEMLLTFVDPLFGHPAILANPWLPVPRGLDFTYSKIFLIAHSLGAPVTRRMLLKASRAAPQWLQTVRPIFFAPANSGARAERVARMAGTQGVFLLSIVYSFLNYRWPVIDDLTVGSSFLKKLARESRQAARAGLETTLRPLRTFFGELENIIAVEPPYSMDAPYTIIPQQDHFTVCKPRRPQDAAYVHLKDVLP